MGFECKCILRSKGPHGKIVSTLEVTYPRFIHAEILTHRDRERNSGSSRAIPWPTMCERIEQDPVIPLVWGAEQKGMQTGDAIPEGDRAAATKLWLEARDSAVSYAKRLHLLGVHKSLCNRITEPWMWITVVMTATEWNNLFRQRCHPDAEIHFQQIAYMMRETLAHVPFQVLNVGEYHLPYFDYDESEAIEVYIEHEQAAGNPVYPLIVYAKMISVARCARVSYVQHGEKRRNVAKDIALWTTLRRGSEFGHWSPFGHVCSAVNDPNYRSGPFLGFKQFRKEFATENAEG